MIEFTKPDNLNGAQLIEELKAAGIVVKDFPTLDGNNVLLLDLPKKDEAQAQDIVANHKGIDASQDAADVIAKAALLERLGISEEEAKLLMT